MALRSLNASFISYHTHIHIDRERQREREIRERYNPSLYFSNDLTQTLQLRIAINVNYFLLRLSIDVMQILSLVIRFVARHCSSHTLGRA